jgi:L-asparaginase/Glu-tRNA(Gln) amidotransferase subunit D
VVEASFGATEQEYPNESDHVAVLATGGTIDKSIAAQAKSR